MVSVIVKGDEYIIRFPKKRLLKTLMNFDIAVLIFICSLDRLLKSFDKKMMIE